MFALVLTNLTRRKARTLATALGIGLGIGTIVALLSVGSGLKRTAGELVHLGAADMGIFQAGVSDPTASALPVSLARRLERRPDVARATPIVLVIEAVRQDPAAVVFGIDPKGFVAQRLVMTEGRAAFGARQVVLGDRLASELRLRSGSALKLDGRPFAVTGVYHTGIFFEDAGAAVSLPVGQRLAHRPGEATTIAVQLATGVRHDAGVKALRKALPGTQVIGDAEDAARAGANGRLVSNAVTIIAALALLVGGLGVLNTMAMAVLERRRELALLSAVGWSRSRVASLVLLEGVITSIFGAGIGVLLGIIGAGRLNDALGVSSVTSPHVTPWTVGQALLIGVAVGIVGGLYPAWRGTSVSPAELLSGA
ncbi:MAG TPA: ABC transporter permease [Solirubrobacteraceae bacterium]|nr:ABC transporter permease [Solirubrobacteraceae bacterium]